MNIRKSIALVVAVLTASSFFFACNETGNNDELSQNSQTSAAETQNDESSEALVPYLDPTGLDLQGFDLKILTSIDSRDYAVEQFVGYLDDEGETDPINMAVYERNAKLEQEYGFTISYEALDIGFSDYITKVRNDMAGGTADYQVLANGSTVIAPLTVEGYCYDLYNLKDSYLHLDEDWWDPVTQEDMSIENHLYMATGDIMILDDQFTQAMFFNKDLINKYNLESPYQLVYSGKWTMDAMYEMMKAAAHPAGDGTMDVENGDDTWGMVGVVFDTYQLVMGGGDAQVTKDADDLPKFAMTDETNVNTFLKVFDIVTDKSTVAFKESYYSWDNEEGEKVIDHFYNGYALFMPNTIYTVGTDKMRNAEIHYGILPMPKYDEAQEKYASTIEPYHFFVLAIPTNNTDNLDKITFCLEAMAYLGSTTVTPAYYDVTLKLKRFSDDDDSPEMLDIIFSNRIVDISIMFNWNDCIQYYNRLFAQNNNGIASYCQSVLDGFNADMQETIDAYKKLSAD